MTALQAQRSRSGLDLLPPRSGRAADAYEVARTATWLAGRRLLNETGDSTPGRVILVSVVTDAARHAVALHLISGRLHRLAERACNEDLGCRYCQGEGRILHREAGRTEVTADGSCKACAGAGRTTGRTVVRLERQAREIAAHYACRAYFQGDPRGCALTLVPEEIIPANVRADSLFQAKVYETWTAESLREQWIGANYNRGHSVSRLGR